MLTLERLCRRDDGNILVSTVLVSMLIAALASLTLTTGEQADRSSARDRNHDIALGVAEAAIHEASERTEDLAAASFILPDPGDELSFSGETNEGEWDAVVKRIPEQDGFTIDATAVTGTQGLRRTRRVRVWMRPAELFPAGKYALYSKEGIVLKTGNDIFDGDVWADGGEVQVAQGTTINGSITSAVSSIRLENGSSVTKFVQTGGIFCEEFTDTACTDSNAYGLRMDSASILKYARVSVSSATCPPAPEQAAYRIRGSGSIGGDLTTWSTDSSSYSGSVGGTRIHGTTAGCTTAPPQLTMPPFHFNANNYDPDEWGGPNSPVPFPNPMTPAQLNSLSGSQHGVFYVPLATGITPDQTNRLDVSDWDVAGDITIVTDYPVFADGIEEAAGLTEALLLIVSHDTTAGGCDANNLNTDCAIRVRNQFSFDESTGCTTAVLLYADNGPIAGMNNPNNPDEEPDICGAYVGAGIEIMNNLKLIYDPRVSRVLGFHPTTYEVERWEELPVS
jgi:hypothetical protein